MDKALDPPLLLCVIVSSVYLATTAHDVQAVKARQHPDYSYSVKSILVIVPRKESSSPDRPKAKSLGRWGFWLVDHIFGPDCRSLQRRDLGLPRSRSLPQVRCLEAPQEAAGGQLRLRQVSRTARVVLDTDKRDDCNNGIVKAAADSKVVDEVTADAVINISHTTSLRRRGVGLHQDRKR